MEQNHTLYGNENNRMDKGNQSRAANYNNSHTHTYLETIEDFGILVISFTRIHGRIRHIIPAFVIKFKHIHLHLKNPQFHKKLEGKKKKGREITSCGL